MLASIRFVRAACAGLASVVFAGVALGQANPIRMTVSPIVLDSGVQDNDTDAPRVVFSQVVNMPGAPWVRLVFKAAKLPEGSRIHVQSFEDGEEQWLTSEALAQWQGTTAFFNGQAVMVELEAAPHTVGNRVAITGVLTGNQTTGLTVRRVCDATDSRVGSADARVARLLTVPLLLPTCAGGVTCDVSASLCSGFEIDTPLADDPNDRLLLTAGHCLEAAGLNNSGGTLSTIAEFEAIPDTSTITCAMRHPPVARQFPIKAGRTRNSTPGGCSGNDWGVFTCGKNSLNQTVFQSQGEGFSLAAAAPASGSNITKIGYGADGPSSARFCDCVPGTPESAKYGTQQIAMGTVTAPVGGDYLLKHNAHTCGGDSGCALFGDDGKIVGIHTGGGCNPQPSPPMNCGTAITNPQLVAGMAAVAGSAVPRNDTCANALPVLAGTTAFTTLGATTDGPRETLVQFAGSDQIDNDVWFAYTATFTATVVISVCPSDYDTRLAVYANACPSVANTAIAANDDSASCQVGTGSLVSVPVTAGMTYYIRVGGYAGQTGAGTLSILVNDDCTLFNQLITGAAVPNGFVGNGPNIVSSRGFTTTSTGAAGDPFADGTCLGGADMINDAWFIYSAGPAGQYRFDTCAFSNFDTCLAVYRARIPVAPNGPAPNCRLFGGALLGSDDDGCGGPMLGSRVDVMLNANDIVLVRLGSSVAGESGDAVLTITQLPPANDDCANAAPIMAGVLTPLSNLAATDSAVAAPSCGLCARDLWYRFASPAAGVVTADTCALASPPDFDTTIAVYNNDCGALAEIACNDDSCGVQSRVSWNAAAGTSYLIRVGSRLPGGAGSGNLLVTGPVGMGPVNNDCANAQWAVEGAQSFSTVGATVDGPNPVGCITIINSNIQRDVWYRYRSTRVGNLVVDACDASFDARLAGYAGAGCPPGGAAVACGDDDCGTPSINPRMNLPVMGTAMAPNDYLIRLGSFYMEPTPLPADPVADANANAPTGVGTLTLRFLGNDSCATENVNNIQAGNGANPFDTTGANSDGPVYPAGGGAGCAAGGDVKRDLWFLYAPTAAGNATFSVCAAYNNSIAVYVATVGCPPNPPVGCDASNAAAACGKRSSVTVGVLTSRLYWVRVGGATDADFGPGVLTITPPPSVPDNDQCFNAAPIYVGDTPYTTVGATSDGPNPEGCLTAGENQVLGNDVWFVHTAIADGTLLIDSCDSTFDNRIAVYAAGMPNVCTLAGALACGDDDCGTRAQVRVTVTRGRQYVIRVGGYGAGANPMDADIATGTGTLKLRMLANDRCAAAVPIFNGATYFDNTGADTDGAADPACANFPDPDGQINGDLWYIYTATAAGRLVVDTRGSSFDTRLAVYAFPAGAACPPAGAPLDCNDDANPLFPGWSRVGTNVAVGDRIMIRVGGFATARGAGVLNVKIIPNDACALATAVGNGVFYFNNEGATKDGNTSCDFSPGAGADVWFRYTATCDGDLVAHTCDADFDTVLSVLTGGCGAPVEAACNDDAPVGAPCSGTRQSYLRTPVTNGTQYLVRVAGVGGVSGTGRLSLSCEPGGACCNGATCMVTAQSQCTGVHKRFVGSGAACNALGDDTTPCCKADFSQNGIETVQDVFDFLSSWFAGDAGADADGNGTLSVNDIFAFVMQWFNGCP